LPETGILFFAEKFISGGDGKNGGDCCSGNCDTNNGKWLTGVFKP